MPPPPRGDIAGFFLSARMRNDAPLSRSSSGRRRIERGKRTRTETAAAAEKEEEEDAPDQLVGTRRGAARRRRHYTDDGGGCGGQEGGRFGRAGVQRRRKEMRRNQRKMKIWQCAARDEGEPLRAAAPGTAVCLTSNLDPYSRDRPSPSRTIDPFPTNFSAGAKYCMQWEVVGVFPWLSDVGRVKRITPLRKRSSILEATRRE